MKYLVPVALVLLVLTVPVFAHAFTIGDQVQVTTKVNIRSGPTTNGKPAGSQKTGAQGTITGGPQTAKGYTWWTVNFGSGTDGWVAQNYLKDLSSAPVQTPPPPPAPIPTPVPAPAPTPPAPVLPPPSSTTLSWNSVGCAVAPTSFGQAFYVNPNAATNGNGTQASPWNNLATVLSTDVGGSGPVKPGSVIYLMSGNYGDVDIGSVNSGFIGLEAAPGQTPVFHSLGIEGASYWYIHGIKVQSGATATANYNRLVNITGNGVTSAPSTDIIFDGNTVSTVDSVQGWTQAQWLNNLDFWGILTNGSCISITNNSVSNVLLGFSIGSDNTRVDGNTLNDFGDDGLDFTGYNNLFITNNTFTNSNTLGDGNHNDFMQGFTSGGAPANDHSNVLIQGNTLIRQTGTTGAAGVTAFPGDVQGIDIFDDVWHNVQVLQNVVITSAYWGIGFNNLTSGIIANNTVLDDGSNAAGTGGLIWIDVDENDCSVTSSPAVSVENNITQTLLQQNPNAIFTHNLVQGQTTHCVNGALAYDNATGPNWTNNVDDANLLSYLPGFHPATYQFNVTPSSSSIAPNYGITGPTALALSVDHSSLLASIAAAIQQLKQLLSGIHF